MDNLKIYQIYHHLITYFATLISPKKSQLGPIFRTGGSTNLEKYNIKTDIAFSLKYNSFSFYLFNLRFFSKVIYLPYN